MSLPLSKAGRRYGAKRDFHDTRDWTLDTAPVFRLASGLLAPTSNNRPFRGPIKDQGQEGSCTGHAYSSIREYLARKFQQSSPILSPQFLYSQELFFEGDFPNDSGAQPRTGCIILDRTGCCESDLYPYIAGNIYTPSQEQMDNAKKWIGGAYHRIASLADVLSCLASGYPCSVAFAVYESFENSWTTPGLMPIPQASENILGYHEVAAIDYDLPNRVVLIQNSWGDQWGLPSDPGMFLMPFDFIGNVNFVSDLWLSHLGRAWKA